MYTLFIFITLHTYYKLIYIVFIFCSIKLQKTIIIPVHLRTLAKSINLRFDDFSILEGVRGVVSGRRAFHPAIWANQLHVTLSLSIDCNQMIDLNPITEFCDLVPSHFLPLMPNPDRKMVQGINFEYFMKFYLNTKLIIS